MSAHILLKSFWICTSFAHQIGSQDTTTSGSFSIVYANIILIASTVFLVIVTVLPYILFADLSNVLFEIVYELIPLFSV